MMTLRLEIDEPVEARYWEVGTTKTITLPRGSYIVASIANDNSYETTFIVERADGKRVYVTRYKP